MYGLASKFAKYAVICEREIIPTKFNMGIKNANFS
jgi:hypothetical protein